MELVIIDKTKRHFYKYSNIYICHTADEKFALMIDYFALSESERCEDLIDRYDTLERSKEVLEAIVKQQAELNAAVATAQAYATYLTRIHDHEEKIKQLSVFYMPEE